MNSIYTAHTHPANDSANTMPKEKEKEDEITFFVYADEFYYSATQLENSRNPGKVAIASYYLYGHALELLYKSFLYRKRFTLRFLKSELGHNLEKALMHAIDNGLESHLDIDNNYPEIVKDINMYYSTKEFEYMSRTEKSFPHMYDVKDVVERTRNSVHELLLDHLWNKK